MKKKKRIEFELSIEYLEQREEEKENATKKKNQIRREFSYVKCKQ